MVKEAEYNRLRLFLTVDTPNIDTELERLPMVLMDAIEHRCHAQLELERAQALHKATSAMAMEKLSEIEVNGKPISNAAALAKLPLEPDVIDSLAVVSEVQLEVSLWTGLVDALRQKGHSIKSLSDLTIAGYTSTPSAYERDRAKMAEGRAAAEAARPVRRRVMES